MLEKDGRMVHNPGREEVGKHEVDDTVQGDNKAGGA